MKWTVRSLTTILLIAGLGACGGSEEPGTEAGATGESPMPGAAADAAQEATPSPSVEILEPTNGSTVDGPAVHVVLGIQGMEIRPAGDSAPNSGHHHLYLDHDLTDPTAPVPAIPGEVIHMGDGSSEYVFENVEPGQHRIIAVVGDLAHFPLQPWVVDTVFFSVR